MIFQSVSTHSRLPPPPTFMTNGPANRLCQSVRCHLKKGLTAQTLTISELTDLHQVQKQYELYNIVFETLVTEARFSNKTGLWTVELKDLKTKEIRTRTCNVLVTATGPLSLPKDPPFDTEKFDGDVFHTARWRNDVSLDGKDVVLLGNGCTSAQIVPNIVNKVNSLTQVARGRQHFMPPPAIPSGDWLRALFKWVPGLLYCFRAVLFWSTETAFKRSDIVRGKTSRESALKENLDYVHKTAPQKYWKDLEAHFDVGSKVSALAGGDRPVRLPI